LTKWGFVERYTVWRFHGEGDMSGSASGRNSSSSMVNVDHGGGPSSSLFGHDVASENADFIMMDDFVQDMVNGGGNNDNDEDLGEPALVDPKDEELFEQLINHLDNNNL